MSNNLGKSIPSVVGKIQGHQEACATISNAFFRGYSAYDLAVLNGYEGTEEEWLASLHGKDGIDGIDGVNGRGIDKVVKTSNINNVDTYTIYYTDNTTGTFVIKNGIDGIDGKNGRGIVRIAKTSSSENVDIYTIYYSDATTSNYYVTNGVNGQDGTSIVVEIVANTESEYILKFTNGNSVFITPNLLANVDLTKYAKKEWVEDKNYLTQHQDISGKANVSDLATVATSGSYNDLSNKPVIPTVPTNISDFNNDAGYQTASNVSTSISTALSSVLSYKGTVATVNALPSLNNKIGDVYHVTADGSEYAWNGSAWEELGSSVDLTGYATETWVENQGYLTQHQDISGKANSADLAMVATSGSYNDLIDKPVISTGADWDASEGEDGYVENRPLYKENSYIELINDTYYIINHLAESSEIGHPEWVGWYFGLIDELPYITLNNNEFYKVIFNGTEYFMPTNKVVEDKYIIGNLSDWMGAETDPSNFEYPFFILTDENSDSTRIQFLTQDSTMTEITLSVYKNDFIYHKLDSNYLDTENIIATHTYVDDALLNKVNSADLAMVATSGSYADLSNKPTIPTKTSDLTNDSGFITGYTETDPTVPAWAKASTKPSYTASEVGALPSTTVIPTKTSDLTNDNGFVTQEDVKKQILSDDYTEEKVPYLYRETPYSVASVEEEIVGGTVGWNQLVNPSFNFNSPTTVYGVTFTRNADGSISISGTLTGNTNCYIQISNNNNITAGHRFYVNSGSKSGLVKIWYNGSSGIKPRVEGIDTIGALGNGFYIRINGEGTSVNETIRPQVHDLTACFGSTIADYLYGLEVSSTGAGVSKLKEWGFFTEDYYEYCEPTLKSVEGLVSKKTVGFNQWDEEWERGVINGKVPEVALHSKNFCKILPNTTYYATCGKTDGGSQNRYYFRIFFYDASKNLISSGYYNNITFITPENAAYFKIETNTSTVIYGNVYNHDICINLSDPTRNGQYEPYESHSYPLDSEVVLRGIPKLDSNNNLYYDGDVYPADGNGSRRYGLCDLGTLDWGYNQNYSCWNTSGLASLVKRHSTQSEMINNCAETYVVDPVGALNGQNFTDGKYILGTSGNLFLRNGSTTTPPTGLFIYELATPTTFTAQPYHNPQIVGDTEEFVTTGIIPVGHETKCYAGTMNLINSKADKTTTYTKTEVDTALSAKAGTSVATTSSNGLMSSTDKGRLDDLYADYSSALTALGVN